MAGKAQFYHSRRMLALIKQKGKIHKFDLMDSLKMSISQYEKLTPWMKYKFPDSIFYNRASQEWEWVGTNSTKSPNETKEEE